MIAISEDAKCACCGGIYPAEECKDAYPFATFCLNCEAGCKTACKAHRGHDLRQCRIDGCWRDQGE